MTDRKTGTREGRLAAGQPGATSRKGNLCTLRAAPLLVEGALRVADPRGGVD